MTATELSNRRRTVEGRLRTFAGCEYITTKQLKDWFGVCCRQRQDQHAEGCAVVPQEYAGEHYQ